MVEAVSVGKQSLGNKYPWGESYGGHFLYTLSISAHRGRLYQPSEHHLVSWGEALPFSHWFEGMVPDMVMPIIHSPTFTWGFLHFPHHLFHQNLKIIQ